jgi:hypothetical protein
MPLLEACWHFCRECKRDWSHSVASGTPPDGFFLPCPLCVKTKGFDAVAELEKQHGTQVAAHATEAEEFSVLLPDTRELKDE